MKKIYVLFKTHLDIGFTDLSANVVKNYMENYLPNAMRVARQMRGEKERFIWTTGSWLIEKFLEESPDRKLLEEAIEAGDIRWHGLPFTTHTELMDEGLLNYGIRISGKLDKRFGMQTIAAKMTDVPGHTIGMVPFLAKAGIRFLHIGVNPASRRPKVPTLFWWQTSTGEKILVMYNNDYGELTFIGDSGTAVYFAHTGDNRGPQSVEAIHEVYEELHKKYPEAQLCAGTLEDVAKETLLVKDLPVISEEIGDSWIHGGGTDPKKISQYRGLLRCASKLSESDREKLYKNLLMIPEHTWGLDEKIWLGNTRELGYLQGEYTIFKKDEFRKARGNEKFLLMEKSWEEQRNYAVCAAEAVSEEGKSLTRPVMEEYRREPWDVSGYEKLYPASEETASGVAAEISGDNFWAEVDHHGAVCHLEIDGRTLADSAHRLAGFSYEVFSRQEYARFLSQYNISDEDWAKEDFDKIGMERAISHYQEYLPETREVYYRDRTLVIRMQLPEEAISLYGGMKMLETVVQIRENGVFFDFAWWGKEATRVAEASWLEFSPGKEVTALDKIGTWVDPRSVVSCGNRKLHGVGEGVRFQDLLLKTYDTALVSVGERSMLNFADTLPDCEKGVFCNLHNNVWGTNFPMWYEDDARFRFELLWQQKNEDLEV